MIVDEMLKAIPPSLPLGDSAQPWLEKLVETVNNAIVENQSDLECLTMDSLGKELRSALRSLPAAIQIAVLNDCIVSYGKRRRRQQDRDKDKKIEMEIMEKKLKYNLISVAGYSFIFLAFIFVCATIFISLKSNSAPDTEMASGLFTTVIEIIKLIFSAS